jgi:hypothetical protein
MAAGDYPLPAYAGYIWDRGDALVITLPDSIDGDGHTVVLPITSLSISDKADQRGWLILRDVLHARRAAYDSKRNKPTIADRAAPTRVMVEEMLKAMKPARVTSTEVDIFAQGMGDE